MKQITEYIEEEPINETIGVLLVVLCAAPILAHLFNRGRHSIEKNVNSFWSWVGDDAHDQGVTYGAQGS